MEEAKKVFDKYNNDQQCNPNNTNLVLNADECYNFTDDEYAHGGYPCGSDEKWNTTTCKKYYCDYGYYYSKLEDKCLPDLCVNDPAVQEIILDGEYNTEITINKDNNYEYIFKIEKGEYIYFFEPSEPGYLHCY